MIQSIMQSNIFDSTRIALSRKSILDHTISVYIRDHFRQTWDQYTIADLISLPEKPIAVDIELDHQDYDLLEVLFQQGRSALWKQLEFALFSDLRRIAPSAYYLSGVSISLRAKLLLRVIIKPSVLPADIWIPNSKINSLLYGPGEYIVESIVPDSTTELSQSQKITALIYFFVSQGNNRKSFPILYDSKLLTHIMIMEECYPEVYTMSCLEVIDDINREITWGRLLVIYFFIGILFQITIFTIVRNSVTVKETY